MEQRWMGQFIRRVREQRSWTQEQLAGAANVSARTVQRAEDGAAMGAETLLAIAGALDVSADEIRRGSTDREMKTAEDARADFARNNIVIPLTEVTRGHQVASFFNQALDSYSIQVDDSVSEFARDKFAELEASFTEWSEVWADLTATDRREREKEWDDMLTALREEDCTVTAGVHFGLISLPTSRGLPAPSGPIAFSTLYLIACSAQEPKLVAVRRRTAAKW